MPEVKIGQIVVSFDSSANTGQIACGPVSCPIGSAAGQRFFDELSKIREALVTAQKALFHPARAARTAEDALPEEMSFLKLLVDLELVIHQDEIT